MRPTWEIAEHDPTNLAAAFYSTTTAELYCARGGSRKPWDRGLNNVFRDVAAAVQKLRNRGGKIVFVRPSQQWRAKGS